MNPYIFNFFNGIIFTLAGIWSLSREWDYGFYCAALGILLIVLTYFVRDSNKLFGSIAMVSTLLSTVVLGVVFYLLRQNSDISLSPIAMMTTSGFITSLAFVQCAVGHSKEAACCTQPTDGTECCDKNITKETKAAGCC